MADDERRAEIEAVALVIYESRLHTSFINGWSAEPEALRDRFRKAAVAALDRVRDARGDDEDNAAYDPRPAEVACLARIEEIDIVARTWWAHESGHEPWRDVADAVKSAYKARAGEAIAALDRLREEPPSIIRVRDARDDDEAGWKQTRYGRVRAIIGEPFGPGVDVEAAKAARSPQGEDHEESVMADDERRAEIEAVKRTRPKVGALIGAWRRYADDLEAALDRVRDARGDDDPNGHRCSCYWENVPPRDGEQPTVVCGYHATRERDINDEAALARALDAYDRHGDVESQSDHAAAMSAALAAARSPQGEDHEDLWDNPAKGP